ncbi:MAG: nucleoside deaminase [Thermodesulfobacteria bacterium]|nr:nucleoside deaminase [Thermodesulfobacteriota bacterium]
MDENQVEQHEKWMTKALELAKSALDAGEFPVGCVLVSGDRIVGMGSRLNSHGKHQNELDHAEIVALRQWAESGRPGDGEVVVYSTLEPCLMCTGALLISGIRHIVFAYEDVMGGACGLDFSKRISASANSKSFTSLYTEADPKVVAGVMRQESLNLFKAFFSRPDNSYLKNTLLEQYTLEQA